MSTRRANFRLSPGNSPAAHCDGKRQFDSAKVALEVAARRRRDSTKRVAYHCGTCGKWHLSMAKKRPRRVKELAL